MDPFFDDFVAFENQKHHKFENLFDPDFLSSPFSEHSDSTGIFPTFLPKTIKNFLDVDEGTPSDLMKRESDLYAKKAKPFQIIKQKKEPSPDQSEYNEPAESVVSFYEKETTKNRIDTRSKRISKPERPREKIKFKQDAESIMKRVESKYIPEGFDDPDLDDQSKKKMVQMIRNRVSAQSSRDKKKMYVQQLEEMREELAYEKDTLNRDKNILQERIRKLEHEQVVLIQENENLKKNTSYLCSKCGCTLEYEEPAGNKNIGFTDSALTSPVGLSRGHSTSKNFFGFSLGFAALLCVLFVMNGGLGITPTHRTNFNSKWQDANVCRNTNQMSNIQNKNVCKNTNQMSNNPFEESVTDFSYETLNKNSSLVDEVCQLSEICFQSSKAKNDDLEVQSSKNEIIEQIESDNTKAVENETKKYQDNDLYLALQNKSSAPSCPSDFEFFNKINMGINQEKQLYFFENQNKPYNQPSRIILDVEPAEYVRVVLNKNSINRLNVLENILEIANMRIYQAPEIPEEGNPWIEIWCKIFAIRDVASF